jgi:CBS domain-containing protein
VGIVSNEGLRRAPSERGASTRTFEAVMRTHFARAYPWQNVSDAAVARGDAAYRGVVVVSADGTFLGLVTEYDLPNAA